jgi:hypothetical protein
MRGAFLASALAAFAPFDQNGYLPVVTAYYSSPTVRYGVQKSL